jgi:hypothetical protein
MIPRASFSRSVADRLLRLLRSITDGNLRGTVGELQVAAVLDRIGIGVLHDVVLPDGRGGLTQVDHLVLTAAGILVVETKNYGGMIFGREGEPTWTQRVGRQTHAFQNPLRQNHLHVQAVRALAPGVRVMERVVFTDRATFPKGIPSGVSALRALVRDLRDAYGLEPGTAPPDLLDAWETIKNRAERSPEARDAHMEGLQERFGPKQRPTVAWGGVAGSVVGFAVFWWLVKSAVPTHVVPAPGRTPGSAATAASAAQASGLARPSLEPSAMPAWIPLRPAASPPSPRAVSAPALASFRPAPPTRAVPPGSPPYLVRAEPPPSPQEASAQACNSAIASLLIDNSAENRAARDSACGKVAQTTPGGL